MINRAYEILELQPGTPKKEVKQAFHDLLKVWHPDKFVDDARMRQKAEQKTRDIIWAYETILFHIAKPKSASFRYSTASPGPEIKPHFDPSFMARQTAMAHQKGAGRRWGTPAAQLKSFYQIPLIILKTPFILLEFFITTLLAWRLGMIALAASALLVFQISVISNNSLAGRAKAFFQSIAHVFDDPPRPQYMIPGLKNRFPQKRE